MSRKRKEQVRDFLLEASLTELASIASRDRRVFRVLFSFTYHQDLLFRFRAIQTVGLAARDWLEQDFDRVQDLIRRLLWSMNDESGGLGWR